MIFSEKKMMIFVDNKMMNFMKKVKKRLRNQNLPKKKIACNAK